jgi:hypothetical protein
MALPPRRLEHAQRTEPRVVPANIQLGTIPDGAVLRAAGNTSCEMSLTLHLPARGCNNCYRTITKQSWTIQKG